MVDRVEQEAQPSEVSPQQDEPLEDVVRRGRWSGTPFVLLGGIAVTIWLVVGVVAGIVLVVWWLA